MSGMSTYGRARARVRAARQRLAYAAWERAERAPRVYLAGCLGLALVGYALLAAFPLLALFTLLNLPEAIGAASGPLDWLAVAGHILTAGFGAAVTAYLVRLRFPLPRGLPLSAEQAPELFRALDEIAEELDTPLPPRVLVTGRFQSECRRTPRHGFAFSFDRTLLIGLPVMQTLSPTQLRGMLAAQLGRATLRRRPLIGWLCSLRPLWGQFRDARATGRWAFIPALVRGPFLAYAPLYAYATRLAARWELNDLDDYALEVINDEDVMQLLVAEMLAERFLTRHYWPKLRTLVGRGEAAGLRPFAGMTPTYRRSLERGAAERWLREALGAETAPDAQRPNLSQRLEGIGHDAARVLQAPDPTAAEALLGPALLPLQQHLDSRWRQAQGAVLRRRARASAAADVSPRPAATS